MTPREPREGGQTPPQRMAETTPTTFPSGDYTYVLEIVMRMQDTVGQLREAVSSLKDQSKHHGEKLDQIGKDVHAAKVVGTVLAAVGGLLGWVLHEIMPLLSSLKAH